MSLKVAGIGPAGIDPEVAALAPSQLAERLCERGVPGMPLGIVRGDIREHADASHLPRLLCAHSNRPRSRTAKQGDDVAPLQSIELHLLAKPTLGQHIASVRIKSAPRCGARFRPGERPSSVMYGRRPRCKRN